MDENRLVNITLAEIEHIKALYKHVFNIVSIFEPLVEEIDEYGFVFNDVVSSGLYNEEMALDKDSQKSEVKSFRTSLDIAKYAAENILPSLVPILEKCRSDNMLTLNSHELIKFKHRSFSAETDVEAIKFADSSFSSATSIVNINQHEYTQGCEVGDALAIIHELMHADENSINKSNEIEEWLLAEVSSTLVEEVAEDFLNSEGIKQIIENRRFHSTISESHMITEFLHKFRINGDIETRYLYSWFFEKTNMNWFVGQGPFVEEEDATSGNLVNFLFNEINDLKHFIGYACALVLREKIANKEELQNVVDILHSDIPLMLKYEKLGINAESLVEAFKRLVQKNCFKTLDDEELDNEQEQQ